MGYCLNRIDVSLADVITSEPEHDDLDLDYAPFVWLAIDDDWQWDYEPDPLPDPDYRRYDELEQPVYDSEPDPFEHLPFIGKISPAACLGFRVMRHFPDYAEAIAFMVRAAQDFIR